MWRTSFGGANDFGVGSAIAVFIFVLVIPVLLAQHPPFPEGGLMATAAEAVAEPHRATEESAAIANPACARRRRRSSILLVILSGSLWLVPTIGLFLTSLLSPEDYSSGGWWQVFSEPSKLDVRELRGDLRERTITSSL